MSNVDRYEITYRSKWTGKNEVHVTRNNESDARGWAESLAAEHGSKATAESVSSNGTRTHIVTEGHDRA